MTEAIEAPTGPALARAAARRVLDQEHRIAVRTLDRRQVVGAVNVEAWGGEVTHADVDAAMMAIRTVRVTYSWADEDAENPCGAEPEAVLAEMGCKPCSLPAGHDGHRYPYPMSQRSASDEAVR